MATFSDTLLSNRYAEWSSFYIDYDHLKVLIAAIPPSADLDLNKDVPLSSFPQTPISYDTFSPSYTSSPRDEFLTALYSELDKVNRFFEETLEKQRVQFASLLEQCSKIKTNQNLHEDDGDSASDNEPLLSNVEKPHPTAPDYHNLVLDHVFRDEISMLYRRQCYLTSFSELNYIGFLKIADKYDRIVGNNSRYKLGNIFKTKVESSSFFKGLPVIQQSLQATESLYARIFESNDVVKARMILLAKKNLPVMDWRLFAIGLKIGSAVPLIVWYITVMLTINLTQFMVFMPVFRCIGFLTLALWAYGCLLFVLNRARINICFILNLDIKTSLTHLHTFEEASSVSLVLLVSLVCFCYFEDEASIIPASIFPSLLVLFCLFKLCLPWLFSHWPTRRFFFISFLEVIKSPFGKCFFMEFFLADIMTSLVKVLVDIVSIFCLYCSGDGWTRRFVDPNSVGCGSTVLSVIIPIVVALPYWWRLMQCLRKYYETRKRWPWFGNAIKYGLAMIVVLFGAFHPLYASHIIGVTGVGDASYWSPYKCVWIATCVVSTLYTAWWDVFMDFGFGWSGWRANPPFLRDQLISRHASLYYFIIILNIVLRFVWILTLLPVNETVALVGLGADQMVFIPFLTGAEIIRRFIWAAFRLENEQLHNSENYRETGIRVPLYFETETQLGKQRIQKTDHQWNKIFEIGIFVILIVSIAIGTYFVK